MVYMTITFNPADHPREDPAHRGRFTDKPNSEPEASLDDSVDDVFFEHQRQERQWGETGVREGSRTPWGQADWVTPILPGMDSVSTPGHGGVKLSKERNKMIPAPLRNSSGWYEEDCEVNIVGYMFPEAFPRSPHADFAAGVKNWFPDQWEAATGEKLQPGESHVRDEANWLQAHADDYVAYSAMSRDDGMVVVSARKGDGSAAEFLVPKDEYRTRRENKEIGAKGRFVVDPSRHEMLPPKVAPVAPPVKRYYLDTMQPPRTLAGQEKIAKDLHKRWRESDGTISTLAEIIERVGVADKAARVENGKRIYTLGVPKNGSTYVYQVSKATWDAISAPDARTRERVLQQDIDIAKHTFETSWDVQAVNRAKARLVKLRAEVVELMRTK